MEPFTSAEAAWMWCCAALEARREGRKTTTSGPSRPCEPDDIIRVLDVLYRRHRIGLAHARVLRIWGWRQMAPLERAAGEQADWRLWHEALDLLDWPLRVKGIVA